jgi:hypothetical protein
MVNIDTKHLNQKSFKIFIGGPEIVSEWGIVAGSCEHGNKPSGSIKGGEFLDYLSDS